MVDVCVCVDLVSLAGGEESSRTWQVHGWVQDPKGNTGANCWQHAESLSPPRSVSLMSLSHVQLQSRKTPNQLASERDSQRVPPIIIRFFSCCFVSLVL